MLSVVTESIVKVASVVILEVEMLKILEYVIINIR